MRMAMKHDADADDDPPYMVIKVRDFKNAVQSACFVSHLL